MITTDIQGSIDYMNETAEILTGLNRSNGIGKRLEDLIVLIDEVDRKSLGDPVRKCLTERHRVSLGRRALMLTRHDDSECSVELTASPIRGPDGVLAGCVVIFSELCRHKPVRIFLD